MWNKHFLWIAFLAQIFVCNCWHHQHPFPPKSASAVDQSLGVQWFCQNEKIHLWDEKASTNIKHLQLVWRRKLHQSSCAALYQIEIDVFHPIVFFIIALFHIVNTIVVFISIHCTIIIVLATFITMLRTRWTWTTTRPTRTGPLLVLPKNWLWRSTGRSIVFFQLAAQSLFDQMSQWQLYENSWFCNKFGGDIVFPGKRSGLANVQLFQSFSITSSDSSPRTRGY